MENVHVMHHVPVKILQVIARVTIAAHVAWHHAAKNVINMRIAKKPVVIVVQVQKETVPVSANPVAK